ncbi:MAG: ATP:cob(I)alamin adenosyltransferase [Hyphomicrobium sp.]|nr:ATP:cob(I)alamin adenosyltransferase [Hyphomicrobium sp.]PPC80040.1 MAG: ATP:cob(I)alamin adenosyltransferase [Hyphomicrobium sp.]
MVKLNKIYTKTGDDGTTGLGTGERVAKYSMRISAYGTVDETNATIGMVRIHMAGGQPGLDLKLVRIQNDLFDLGADLCVPDRGKKLEYEPLRITESQVVRLEHEIDEMNAEMKPLKSFILPGGSPAAAQFHVARTVCRRAERLIVELAAMPEEPVSEAVVKYMNRLSDFLFVAGRYVNDRGRSDVLWVPGQNR